jgi:uncharacterized membrane protein
MQRVEKSVRVGAPVEQVYGFWRDFRNFPQFMEHVEDVQVQGDGRRSHWRLKGPLGVPVEYDAMMTTDEPNKQIGWNSGGGQIETTGAVTFNDVGNGQTEVHVVVQWYDPPGGPVGEALSRILQNPDRMLEEDLRRFKGIVEGRTANTAPR